jgi:hypothetical protein
MDEIDFLGASIHQKLLEQQRNEYFEKLLNDTYIKAIFDASQIVQTEFDRWLDDKDEEYPSFDNIFDGFMKLREKRK